MRLDDLRYFLHVATGGSFGRAASLCHVSAPAISKAVRRLEEELDVDLFVRTTRRVSLTPEGEALLEGCQRILTELDTIAAALDAPRGKVRGDLRIGAMEVFSIQLLPRAISSLVKRHPGVRPLTYELVPQRIEDLLLQHRLDVGLTIGGRGVADLEYRELGTSKGVLVCGRSHPLFEHGRITKKKLRDHASVVPRFLGLEHAPSLDEFPDETHPRRVGATIELLQMGVQLALDGTYLGYFPEITVRDHLAAGRLKALRGVAKHAQFSLQAITRPGPLKPAAALLIEEVEDRIRARRS